MADQPRPRRNFLFVPGSRPDRFAKALAHRPDMVTVDLEDAVIPAHKDQARAQAMPLFDIPDGGPGDGIERLVRINSLRTAFGLKDVLALIEHPTPPDGVMLPKVESADEVRIADALLQRAARPIGLHIIIESNAGLDQALAIAGACPSVQSLLFGAVDMAAELGSAMDFTSMLYARSRVVHAAASHGLDAIDVPYLDLDDEAGLREECRLVQALGYHRQGHDPSQAACRGQQRLHARCRADRLCPARDRGVRAIRRRPGGDRRQAHRDPGRADRRADPGHRQGDRDRAA